MSRDGLTSALLQAYVIQVRDALGLTHCRIVIEDQEPEQGPDATVLGETKVEHYGYRAIMRFSNSIFDDPEEVRRVVVHELVHLFVEHWALDVDASRVADLAPAHREVLEKQYERAIEGLTSVLAPFMPGWMDT